MTTQPAGWYDDPQDPSQLRYWDGVVWSGHVSPKISPTVAQSTIGMPYGVIPASARPQTAGSHGAQGAPPAQGGFASPRQGPGKPGGEWPAYGQGPGALGQPQQGWQSQGLATTPDGVVLSGWWKRVLARILDGLIIWVVALPLTYAPLKQAATVFNEYLQQVVDAAKAGSSTIQNPPTDFAAPIMQASLTMLVVYVIYEVAFLTWRGATPGRMVVGISVRLREKAGPPPLAAVLKRTAVKEGGAVFGGVPFLGTIGSLFMLVDDLWPLWDVKKQAIHDKVAATNVVVGPQPRRDA